MPHIHEKIDYTADVFVVYKDRVLIRKHDKHNLWLAVGGHIELDENPNQAAIREVKEEVGLDVELIGDLPQFNDKDSYTELLAPRYMNIHNITPTHQHISLVYFAKSNTDKVIESETETSNEIPPRRHHLQEVRRNDAARDDRHCHHEEGTRRRDYRRRDHRAAPLARSRSEAAPVPNGGHPTALIFFTKNRDNKK